MLNRKAEFSLAELIDHPALGLAMAEEGFDPRSLERILDAESSLVCRRAERGDWLSPDYFPTPS